KVGRFAIEPAKTRLSVGDNGCKRLVYLVGYGCGQFAKRRHARHMREFRLRFSQGLFGLISTDHRSNIGADAAIAEKIAACVKKWLAVCSDIYRSPRRVDGGIPQTSEWTPRVKGCPMLPPLFWFRLDIGCNVPARHADMPRGGSVGVLREVRDAMV